jgi:hypothetical protein
MIEAAGDYRTTRAAPRLRGRGPRPLTRGLPA